MRAFRSARLFTHLLSQGISVMGVSTEVQDGAEVLVVSLKEGGESLQRVPVEFEDIKVVVGRIVSADPEARS